MLVGLDSGKADMTIRRSLIRHFHGRMRILAAKMFGLGMYISCF